jgi:hypothetical protein
MVAPGVRLCRLRYANAQLPNVILINVIQRANVRKRGGNGPAAFERQLPAARCRETHVSRQSGLATAFCDNREDAVRNHLFVA